MSGPDVRWEPPRSHTLASTPADRARAAVPGDVSARIVLFLLIACTAVAVLDLYLLYASA